MAQTVVEKIVQAHLVGADAARGHVVTADDFVAVRPRHVMTHDNTAAVMSKFRGIGASRVHDPRQPVFALDHDIQNESEGNQKKYRNIEAFAREQGIVFHPAGAGIGHQLMIERGFATPGSLVVASDSHSNMYGAVGALGTPVVRTDAAAIWSTGEFWWQVPPTVQVWLEGSLRPGVTGKDLILALCSRYNHEEVLNAALEFGGPGVASLSMDARMAVANMTTEWGALVGWFPVDEITLAYLEERLAAGVDGRFTAADLARWREGPPRPDPDAHYAARITVDLATVSPWVAGPHVVQKGAPLADFVPQRLSIQKAYVLSCVNSRGEDLAAAAAALRGRKVAPGVALYVAAASETVEREARARGDWQSLIEAGAIPLPPSCGPCIGLGTGLLEPGERGISATNRNFKGRMGSAEAEAYLASPAVVAASAVAGYIAGPDELGEASFLRPLSTSIVSHAPAIASERPAVEIVEGFPAALTGRLVFLPQDNLNTDGIYGKDYTYREDMSREDMARVVMENYDPDFAGRTRAGDIVVGGFNFGTGSSREQAVTALQAKGLPLVIAGSYSQTYLRNAFNNGFLCVASSALVQRLRALFADEIARGERTIISEEATVDFVGSRLVWRGESFAFPPLGPVPQALVVDGGVENQLKKRLDLE